jgi:hypothetical protein
MSIGELKPVLILLKPLAIVVVEKKQRDLSLPTLYLMLPRNLWNRSAFAPPK